MKNIIRRFPNDVNAWWNKVLDDVKWAENNYQGGFYNQTCFVAQQIVEKALKTFLLANNKVVEKVHKLPLLLKQCVSIDKSFEDFLDHAKEIDRYYITTRYPPSFGGIEGSYTQKEAEKALNLAKELVEFVKKKITL